MILVFATDFDLLDYLDRDVSQRMDDLAQTLAAWTPPARRSFLERWGARHGDQSAEQLRERLRALWKMRGEAT